MISDLFDYSLDMFQVFLETDLEHDGPQNGSWPCQWSQIDIRYSKSIKTINTNFKDEI